MKISVIGAGNGGQAIAAYAAIKKHVVSLYDRNTQKIQELRALQKIILEGKIKGEGYISLYSDRLDDVVHGADVIMVTTVANAHYTLAVELSNLLTNGQVVLLNPGRTGGALEFKNALKMCGFDKRVYVAEAQTLVYACRLIENGKVNIIGIKDKVLFSSLPASDNSVVQDIIQSLYPSFIPAENVLRTSFENIGAIFHPCVLLFNAATIERKDDFYFYRDMTPKIANFIEEFDLERIAVAKQYGIDTIGVKDWISYAYEDTKGDTLCEKMRNNPAYYDIKSPTSIYTRQLMEDIPTGIIPLFELGKKAGLRMKLFESVINICETLLSIDFYKDGRTLSRLGIDKMSVEQIVKYLS